MGWGLEFEVQTSIDRPWAVGRMRAVMGIKIVLPPSTCSGHLLRTSDDRSGFGFRVPSSGFRVPSYVLQTAGCVFRALGERFRANLED